MLEFLEISGFQIRSTETLANTLKDRPQLVIAHNNQAFLNSDLPINKLLALQNKYKYLLKGKDFVPLWELKLKVG